MPITTYIVDDETSARERLICLFDHFLKGELAVIGQSSNPTEALKQMPKQEPEILLSY